jgi:hypothetical protein
MIECLFIDKPFPNQPPEIEEGNKEYKRYFSFKYLNRDWAQMSNKCTTTNPKPDKDCDLKRNRKRKRRRKNNMNMNEHRVQEKLNQRASQMLYRIHEGDGKALYLFGVDDDGTVVGLDEDQFKDTLFYLEKIVDIISADIKSIKCYPCFKNSDRQVITCRILRKLNTD